ncbi:MAG: hypothetical protein IPJ03_15910 [Ignavibacteriales bacterium]|nr:hypothetical protein [Ignavibacteriales bacterium]
MAEIKFITPFAEVKILIDKKDEWAKEEIEDWICHKCGVPSGSDIQKTFQAHPNFAPKRTQMRQVGVTPSKNNTEH